MTTGDTMPRTKLGRKKIAPTYRTMRGRNVRPNVCPATACVTTRMPRLVMPPAMKMRLSVCRDAYRSATNPPKKLPPDMPARTTPMMLVQVYSDTPMYGAMMRPAISSITSVQALLMKARRHEIHIGRYTNTHAAVDLLCCVTDDPGERYSPRRL